MMAVASEAGGKRANMTQGSAVKNLAAFKNGTRHMDKLLKKTLDVGQPQ